MPRAYWHFINRDNPSNGRVSSDIRIICLPYQVSGRDTCLHCMGTTGVKGKIRNREGGYFQYGFTGNGISRQLVHIATVAGRVVHVTTAGISYRDYKHHVYILDYYDASPQ